MKISPTERVRGVCKELEILSPNNFIFIDAASQSLTYYKESAAAFNCAVSTSRFGIGNRDGSYMTPLGLHRVEEKIGDGAEPWTIFRNRKNTGEVWSAGMDDDNQILTRILRLRGLEPGVNVGDGIDSYERYIYIHGTNREDLIGTSMSHGCVCMKNDDVITLYNMAEEGTLVYISGDSNNVL